jgi:uncharacterized membrane protein YqjE
MSDSEPPPAGLFSSLRRLADLSLGYLANRAELFSIELQEEKSFLIEVLLWAVVLLFFGMLAVLLLTATIIFLFAPDVRIYVAGGFSFLYFWGAVWAFFRLKSRLKCPMPFSQSIEEVKKDRQWLS